MWWLVVFLALSALVVAAVIRYQVSSEPPVKDREFLYTPFDEEEEE